MTTGQQDAAALLARVDADVAALQSRRLHPYTANTFEQLATALRAALADQRRWQFIAHHSGAILHEHEPRKPAIQLHFNRDVPVDWPSGMTYADNLARQIDAAMTADGGGV